MSGEKVLGIETSCDETSVAVVAGGEEILANIISSQIKTHKRYGGVVPEIASRKHVENIAVVVEQALTEAALSWEDINAVAVTQGPGLVGALLVGVSTAKAIAYSLKKPLLGIHHLMGHIYAVFLENKGIKLPLLCLVVSGGHTSLLVLEGYGRMRLLGQTRDDAAGEAFDKVARALGLSYPGGPEIERIAREGNAGAIQFPRAWLEGGSLDFSFSGLKSAVLNYINRAGQKGEEVIQEDVAASFQQAVIDVLVGKAFAALKDTGLNQLAVVGGVAANGSLTSALRKRAVVEGAEIFNPSPILCTDNGAMIACAGYHALKGGQDAGLDLNAVPNLPLNYL
ncbi:tRNA (adenosine(37)-N6)-threonylcarbamoyltransferase complex transferase subunit TsaD [Metallumcola ferriviriculae]|uniref:tRNA N6-adenosine threonylcarbamoyltransferase n=1 Tax=Metallumcola ferriviriculae TaxID=3039180 RepID=A0AAU0URD0_9FIRM|nr:tRNA (adenosine(37)-N6)-threonylcarbamoyltransferase complex transferase subunit TsaD [Desulfitibacteraceae bacterium MK1]